MLACDSGPESGSAKFLRLQLRLRLKSKRSTPTDSNSGLDSAPAALMICAHGRFISCLGILSLKSIIFNIANRVVYGVKFTHPSNKLNDESLLDYFWYYYSECPLALADMILILILLRVCVG